MKRYRIGIDPGFNYDPTVISVFDSKRNEQKHLYCIESYGKEMGIIFEESFSKLSDIIEDYPDSEIFVDTIGIGKVFYNYLRDRLDCNSVAWTNQVRNEYTRHINLLGSRNNLTLLGNDNIPYSDYIVATALSVGCDNAR